MPYLDAATLRTILAGQQTGQAQPDYNGTAAVLDDTELDGAVTQAQAEVDGRLATRGYTVPFANPPQIVIDITGDIAAYLATLTYRKGNPVATGDPIQLRYNRAETLLTQAVAGTLLLDDPTTNQPDAAAPDAVVTNPWDGDLWEPADFRLTTNPAGFPMWPRGF